MRYLAAVAVLANAIWILVAALVVVRSRIDTSQLFAALLVTALWFATALASIAAIVLTSRPGSTRSSWLKGLTASALFLNLAWQIPTLLSWTASQSPEENASFVGRSLIGAWSAAVVVNIAVLLIRARQLWKMGTTGRVA